MTTSLDAELAEATAEAALIEGVGVLLEQILEVELEGCGGDGEDAERTAIEAEPDIVQTALEAVAEAVAAAGDPLKDPVGSAHYEATLDATMGVLYDVLETILEYDAQTASQCSESAGMEAAAANAALVAAAVAASDPSRCSGQAFRSPPASTTAATILRTTWDPSAPS